MTPPKADFDYNPRQKWRLFQPPDPSKTNFDYKTAVKHPEKNPAGVSVRKNPYRLLFPPDPPPGYNSFLCLFST